MSNIAPADEAAQALVAKIRTTGSVSSLDTIRYSRLKIDKTEKLIDGIFQIDLVILDETQLAERLDTEDNTSHKMNVVMRRKINRFDSSAMQSAALAVRKIFFALNNFTSIDRRVQVWDCDTDPKENPNKEFLKRLGLFISTIKLRVEVQREQ